MTPSPAKPTVRSLLTRLTRSLETFHALREEAPLHLMVVFLYIAQRKGIGAAELGRLTGLSQSSVSRNVQTLGRGKDDDPGLGLVSKTIDPKNPRAHVIRLTPKGVALARGLVGRSSTAEATEPSAALMPILKPDQHLHWENWID